MSGHSKWSTIKRKKGVADARRGQLFTKLAREIQLAAREGGPDPDANFKLRLAVDKARANNMPKENIERAIRRGAGLEKGVEDFVEAYLEAYGPHGIAYMIQVVTDNRNRTIAEVRRLFNRAGGSLAEAGAVSWQFETKGLITVAVGDGVTPDTVFEYAIEAGADDVDLGEETVDIYTAPDRLKEVQTALAARGLTIATAELVQAPKNRVPLAPHETVQNLNLVEALEELDDVARVYTNLEISDEALTEFEQAA